jgi:hypothetical protein
MLGTLAPGDVVTVTRIDVLNSSSRTLGNSWLGTWNSEALAKIPSKLLSGNRIESKS